MKFLFSVWSAWLLAGSLQAQQLAFPGAEGYGAYASGGRGCQVVHVTNLNAAGTGSLADAVSQPNRFVVFDVGGIIDITGKSITIASNITIAGQTAPGEGITIYGGRVIASGNKNIIMRYIRMRGGKSLPEKKYTLTLEGTQNFIMDHCSVSWGTWDNVNIKSAYNITWQYCINSEGIEPQRFGAITDGTSNWTIHHCLWANNKSRNPKMKCAVQYYNNVVYNYAMGVIGGHSAADNYQDVINNYFIAGPSGSAKYFDDWTATDHLYSSGNYFDGNCDGVLNGSLITDHNSATPMANPNFKTTHPMNVETAAQAYATVVEHVGASRVRDSHDRRILEQLTSLGKKGSLIANEDELGGIGTVANGPRPADSDNDGMADDWERENGLNVNVNDANAYTLGGGYTNIEHYVNSLAQKSSYLMYPTNPEATLLNATTVQLKWTVEKNDEAETLVVEQSEDGKTFTPIQQLAPTATQTKVEGLIADKVYYFRMKVVGANGIESLYSATVSVNDEYMRPGGGTRAGMSTFTPVEGKIYRIINYATVPYNSETTLQGTAKYLTFNDNGTLGATEDYLWDNPDLLWVITPVAGGFTIRNYGNKKYIAGADAAIAGENRIGTSDVAATLTINYLGDKQPSQSGLYGNVSMYRINSPYNHDYQIRAKGFGDNWFYGNGTIDRADMAFTFVEIDASLVSVFLTKFNSTLDNALKLANGAQTDVTLGFPSEAVNQLMNVIADAQSFANSINEQTTQEEIDAQVSALTSAITTFNNSRIYTFDGFSTDLAYLIYSYGTHPGARDANASTSIQRRYLYALANGTDGGNDGLVYRIGLSDNDINGGKTDAYMTDPAALWAFESAGNGYVKARNLSDGQYLQIENQLSVQPVSIHPYYAKQDNGKMAFYMDATEAGTRLFNVGAADSDGKGGPLEFFAAHADRTRLRWVIEETDVEVNFPTGISSLSTNPLPSVRYFTLEGVELTTRPSRGIYLESTTAADGSVKVRKVLARP